MTKKNEESECNYPNFMIWFIANARNEFQSETARNLNVTRQAVHAWRMGINKPSLEMLYEICKYFETPEKDCKYLMTKAVNALILDIKTKNGDYDSIIGGMQ